MTNRKTDCGYHTVGTPKIEYVFSALYSPYKQLPLFLEKNSDLSKMDVHIELHGGEKESRKAPVVRMIQNNKTTNNLTERKLRPMKPVYVRGGIYAIRNIDTVNQNYFCDVRVHING